MADTAVHSFTQKSTPVATDEMYLVQSPFGAGDDRRATLDNLDDYLKATAKTLTNKTIDLTSNTLTMTSLQLKTALTDETGSGAAVFANTPTLVTPTLGVFAATNGTIATGTITTSQPLTLTQTWNDGVVTFKTLLVNVTATASASASLFADFQIAGNTKLNIDKNGRIFVDIGSNTNGARGINFLNSGTTINGGIYADSGGSVYIGQTNSSVKFSNGTYATAGSNCLISWTNASNDSTATVDLSIGRAAAASLQLGAGDVDTGPVAQTLRTQGALAAGTSNVAGVNWTFIASPGKGTGAGGNMLFQTAPAGSSGTTVNTPVTALSIGAGATVTTTTSRLGSASTHLFTTGSGVSPMVTLQGTGAAGSYLLFYSFGTVTNIPAFFAQPAGGTSSSPTAIASGANMFQIGAAGYDGTNYGGSANIADADIRFLCAENFTTSAHGTDIVFRTTPLTTASPVVSFTLSASKNAIVGSAAIATNATDGFLYIPTCAGTPTGTPTTYTGRIAMVYDTTNHQFWFYDSGWKQPKTPAAAAIVTWQ